MPHERKTVTRSKPSELCHSGQQSVSIGCAFIDLTVLPRATNETSKVFCRDDNKSSNPILPSSLHLTPTGLSDGAAKVGLSI